MTINQKFSAYIFDVDGTLVDSAIDICGAVQTVLRSAGRDDIEDTYLRTFIGRHLDELWAEVFPGCKPERMLELLNQYRAVYHERRHGATAVYPGVRDMLSRLLGKKSTATTKSTQTTHSVLELFGLQEYFDHIQGTDGFPAKPHPDVLFKAAEGLGASVSECLFIGDSAADMEAASRAGMTACAVTWGYGRSDQLLRWKPAYIVNQPKDLTF